MKKLLAVFCAIVCLCLLPVIVKADLPDQDALEAKANAVLDYLDLEGKSDYEIIFAIYDYMCQNL